MLADTSAAHRAERTVVMAPNEVWSMDFISDALFDGRRLRALTLLDAVAVVRGVPRSIRVDNGPEFVSNAFDRWAHERDVVLDFSRPGKPTDNAFVESFNGRLREECLNAHWFLSLDDARGKIEAWRTFYNESRPHSALGDRTPSEFARQAGVNPGLSGASEAGKLT